MVFSATLPVKPSVTTTSTVPGRDIVTFDETVELERREVASHAGFRRRRVQCRPSPSGPRSRHSAGRWSDAVQARQDGAGEDIAHDGKFNKITDIALHVRAEVEHHHVAAARRTDRRGHRWPVDARQRLPSTIFDSTQQRPGIAGRDPRPRPHPSSPRLRATRMEESFLRRSASCGRSSMPTTSLASTIEQRAGSGTPPPAAHCVATADEHEMQVRRHRKHVERRGNGDFCAVVTRSWRPRR